jgi:hypothetical protein
MNRIRKEFACTITFYGDSRARARPFSTQIQPLRNTSRTTKERVHRERRLILDFNYQRRANDNETGDHDTNIAGPSPASANEY